MAKQESSALLAAATAFDGELAAYQRLGELFLRSPLDTVKHVERANAVLDDLAKSEGRLQEAGQQLVAALTAARAQQEALGQRVVEHAPALQERNRQLQALVAALGELAASAAALTRDTAAHEHTPAEAGAAITELTRRAGELADGARTAGFAELASQAHALFQRLDAVARKLPRPS
ncbi:MAG: hypothetical protein KF773_27225 [Deltaproteobacteria bacterium]|nr:hypothetical protein [Deltaproteobacteria bacterium]MCW5803025.1 hypothetical protein [Deltaproteobacteria bacterium]